MTDYRKPRLEHLCDIHIDLETPQVIGAAPAGHRQIYIVKGGTVAGPRLKGTVLPGGGDWALMRTDGTVQLDVRATLETADGALIYTTYSGLIILPPDVLGRITGGEDVPLAEYYFYTNPMFQTTAEGYTWLNRTIAIGRGKAIAGAVEYRLWTVSDPA